MGGGCSPQKWQRLTVADLVNEFLTDRKRRRDNQNHSVETSARSRNLTEKRLVTDGRSPHDSR